VYEIRENTSKITVKSLRTTGSTDGTSFAVHFVKDISRKDCRDNEAINPEHCMRKAASAGPGQGTGRC
jgi:hypothetical protein